MIIRIPRATGLVGVALSTLLLSTATATLECNNIKVNGLIFNLDVLKGVHHIYTSKVHTASYENTTYSINLCEPLKRNDDQPAEEQCPSGTRVCAVTRVTSLHDKTQMLEDVVPIAGASGGDSDKEFAYEATLLSRVDDRSDTRKEGLRLELKGGEFAGRIQRTVVDFLCDRDKVGTEDEWVPEPPKSDKEGDSSRQRRREEDSKSAVPTSETQFIKDGAPLVFNGYHEDDDGKGETLRLTWHTKHVCERWVEDDENTSAGGWGFFSWFFLLAFLAGAGYLVFITWLNHARYAARGWDLLPHSDLIRDFLYFTWEWAQQVLDTVKGPRLRGGYRAI